MCFNDLTDNVRFFAQRMLFADFQAIIGGGLAFAGIWLGFYGNRRRDERLRRQEARALALALYGELAAALTTCRAFVGMTNKALAESHDKTWLDQEVFCTNFGPHVRTKVYEANLDKLGLLGESLVGGADPREQLVIEIVFIFDMLFDFARIADKQRVITNRALLSEWSNILPLVEHEGLIRIQETMDILQAYIDGGLPAATKAAHKIMPDRKIRQDRLGRELGIVPATTDDGETES